MTGTIVKIMGKASCCYIESTDKTMCWAHRADFPDPNIMQPKMEVQFRLKPTEIPPNGKGIPVTDVVALTHSTNSIR